MELVNKDKAPANSATPHGARAGTAGTAGDPVTTQAFARFEKAVWTS